MTRHAALVKDLADQIRRLEVRRLAYFHTDHFEPWRPVGNGPAVGPAIVESIHDFCRVTERIDFARRLTLFYKPHLNYALRKGDGLVRADPDDLVGFLPRTEEEERNGREAMREVATSSAHDIQVHIHHEYYTATTAHTDPASVQWFAGPLGRSLDARRLELAIGLNREIIARETGRTSERWFFVHGHWALNGSDRTSCTIDNEIELLLRNGCRGDFTFPAGRPHTNPRIKVPYLCRPHEAPKGYDLPEAEPEIACGNVVAATGKFFIWASAATSVQCSLDYMSPGSRRHLDNTEKAARDLLEGAYRDDGRLYIKTHAHSLHPYYFEHARMPVFPHQYPAAQTILTVLFDAATQAGVEVEFLTAPEVYDLLLSAPDKPEIDLVARYLEPVRRRRFGFSWPVRLTTRERPGQELKPSHQHRLAPEMAVELVKETSARVLGKRIETMGAVDSGAYEHYSLMLQQGRLVSSSDVAARELVAELAQTASFEACHEIGSGLGTLPFLLVLDGYAAVGIEADGRRHQTAEAIWTDLHARVGIANTACRLACCRFPDLPRRLDPSRAIAILTDFVTTQSPQREQAIWSGLRRYPFLLVDLRRFCIIRNTAEEQQVLLERFSADGFEQIGGTRLTADAAFILLENKRPGRDTVSLLGRQIFPNGRSEGLNWAGHFGKLYSSFSKGKASP